MPEWLQGVQFLEISLILGLMLGRVFGGRKDD